jgi:hypothetical protein
MKTAWLKHISESDHGTFGVVSAPCVGYSCFSLELPWRKNKVRMSRIPDGEYLCRIRNSPKFGITFHLQDVEGRSYILIHSLNFAGDTLKGWKTHSHGCIGFGKSKGFIGNQRAILNSRLAVTEFQRLMNNETFKLIIS